MTYKGNVVSITKSWMKLPCPKRSPRPALPSETKQNWRPGGHQPVALHKASGTPLRRSACQGLRGQPQELAQEIWVYDLEFEHRLARVKTPHATGLAVSQGDAPRPRLQYRRRQHHGLDGGRQLKQLPYQGKRAGDTPTQMEVQ